MTAAQLATLSTIMLKPNQPVWSLCQSIWGQTSDSLLEQTQLDIDHLIKRDLVKQLDHPIRKQVYVALVKELEC